MTNDIIPLPNVELVQNSGVPQILDRIRPQWQAKDLIARVKRLLHVDPSSACQRLFNASVHDLREKVVVAGIDIAAEAARQNKLPPITREEDVEEYPTAKLIDLVYHMGLLSRPEWRRVCRCYEIRRDLEHEDDEYEAGIEDCVYIFSTCIDVILSVDAIHLLKVRDVKDLIEQAGSVVPDQCLLDDYEKAPQPRQEEIMKFLLSVALDKKQSDIVQQNAFVCISYLESRTLKQIKLKIGNYLQEKLGRDPINGRVARVAQAAGIFPYLRQSARKDFFENIYKQMEKVGSYWDAYEQHGELLRSFIEVGGLNSCPSEFHPKIIRWLVLTYIGTPGGMTRYGNVRHVFYSNSGAPLIKDIFSDSPPIDEHLQKLRADKEIKSALQNQHVARRFESLVDIANS